MVIIVKWRDVVTKLSEFYQAIRATAELTIVLLDESIYVVERKDNRLERMENGWSYIAVILGFD